MATASSSVAKVCRVSTGPNTSSERISLSRRDAVEDGGPVVEPAEVGVRAAAERRVGAVGRRRARTNPSTRSKCGRLTSAADVGGLVARVALADRRAPARGRRATNSSAIDVLDEDAERAQADLAGVVELLDREVDREVEVGVVEDQQRRLAAELEATAG